MKKQIKSIVYTSIALFGAITLVACNNQEEDSLETKTKKEEQTPKSKKGNWTEADANKFMTDVSSSVPANIRALGDEAVEEILSCYLNKAVLNYEGYDDANENKSECAELAYDCINELVGEENFQEVSEEAISQEKLKEVTDNLEELLKDELPEK